MSGVMVGEDVKTQLRAAWDRSDRLLALLTPEAMRARPIRLRQPFIFYLGHLPAFAWNQVCRGVLGRPSFNAEFDALFERGIDPPAEDAPEAAERDGWPSVDDVLIYRDRVRSALLDSVDEVAARASSDVLAEKQRIHRLVLEHEWMHHETLLYMLHELPYDAKREPSDHPPLLTGPGVEAEWVDVPAGWVTLGASFDDLPFGWDNEFPEHDVDVDAFRIESAPVRNRDFLAFVDDGGYDRLELWSDEAWDWKGSKKLEHPHCWNRRDRRRAEGFSVRTLFRDVPFEEAADWPVQASWAEAQAYARWRGLRLPTEVEFHRAAFGTPSGRQRPHPWGDQPPEPTRGNFDLVSWAPTPTGSFPCGKSAWGVDELVGNGWEWTSTPFAPFPGFRAYARTYPGYSQDFFDRRHYVLLGASWATDAHLIRRSFRNWFQPHYPYVFAKFRCVAG
jgi:ergothioneine biosynthesis protein EgtB